MQQPIKYISIVAQLLEVCQKQLVRLLKKHPTDQLPQFKKTFLNIMQKLRSTQTSKAIETPISQICEPLQSTLQISLRLNKTSVDQRKGLKSQGGARVFRLTGGFKKHESSAIEEEAQINDILQSYRIEEHGMPKMRMKWKSHFQDQKPGQIKGATISNNNIDLLSYTIPEIQHSIRRLSLQRSPQTVKQRQKQMIRTLDSRHGRKKIIPQLF